jgi:hypothetical protein
VAIPGFPGELGLAVKLVAFRCDDEEERVFDAELVDAAMEAAMAEDGLVQQAGFEGGEFFGPLCEEQIVAEKGSFGGVFDAGGGGLDDGADAGLPDGVEGELLRKQVMLAGVAGDLFFAGGRGRAVREAGIGAIGGEFFAGHAQ